MVDVTVLPFVAKFAVVAVASRVASVVVLVVVHNFTLRTKIAAMFL